MSQLPVADRATVRARAIALARQHRGPGTVMLSFYALASAVALVPAWIIGQFTNAASEHALTSHFILWHVFGLLAASLAYAILNFVARRRSYVLGEKVFAQLREDFLASVLALPLVEVERTSTGDLLSRTTNDIDALSRTVRFAVPEWLVAVIQALITLIAMLVVSPRASLASVVSVPLLVVSTRRYLRFARPGYVRERISYATLSGTVAETAEGARTVDAHRLGPRQSARIEGNVRESFYSEMYTLLMRLIWFPTVEIAFALAVATTLAWSGLLTLHHVISVGAATTVTLYVVQLNDPLDRIISWLDELQIGQSSMARLFGVANVRDDRSAEVLATSDETIMVSDVHYAYRPGHDVLHGVTLEVRPGERLAIVGPSGAGKSTLGRLIAGIDAPQRGSVRIGGVDLARLTPSELRRHVALVTQEHHVFLGTLRDNLRLSRPDASDDELRRALAAVDALEWAQHFDGELDAELGSSGIALTPSQAQQLALARLVLADPHTLVLDEATALLDPRAARHLERSLAAVLRGRTVIAIAHRLHTAHDADRVCVVSEGRIVELGTHDELISHAGEYAALWRSWRNEAPSDS